MISLTRERLNLGEKVLFGDYTYPKQVLPLRFHVDLNPKDYVLMFNQEGDSFRATSAISVIQMFNGLNYEDTHKAVLRSGLRVPTLKEFFTHLMNVNLAVRGELPLYNANGELIGRDELQDYVNILDNNSWVWLNGSFDRREGHLDLDLLTVTEIENENLVYNREPLQRCLTEPGIYFVDLNSLNTQGFPTRKSDISKQVPRSSIYFRAPQISCASRFSSSNLLCNTNPFDNDLDLGTFLVADGY